MGKPAGSLVADARMAGRYVAGLRRFLGTPLSEEGARRHLAADDTSREAKFLAMVERYVYGRPEDAYFQLFKNAGIELGDVGVMLEQDGLDGTLTKLLEAGVYLRMDEFKGRRPIERPGLSFQAEPFHFDNPWADPVYVAATGGTTGNSKRVLIGFGHMTFEACYQALFRATFGIEGRPIGMWRPVPPGSAGVSNVLAASKLGIRQERWFSQNPTAPSIEGLREYLFTRFTVAACRMWGPGVASPQHVPVNDALVVAEWLAACKAGGNPAVLNIPVSSGVRVCSTARDHGLDIQGSIMRVGGESLTAGRAAAIRSTGCSTAPHYALAEIGLVGVPCRNPAGDDDVHFLWDKLAVIRRPHVWGTEGSVVGALLFTTLRPTTPKVMINVDSGDYGTIDSRDCGCEMNRSGYTHRISGICSYEKLTSEGMNFLEGDVVALVDRILPGRFGGNPTDFQLVETDQEGVSKVGVIVSPRLGEIADPDVVETVLRGLESGPNYKKMMTGIWEDSGTVEVIRREPYVTAAGKVLPLHFIR